jgi:hypothetical protein
VLGFLTGIRYIRGEIPSVDIRPLAAELGR